MSVEDMVGIAKCMSDAAHAADGEGLVMTEYDDYDFPEQFRQRMQFAMDRWENGVADLLQAAKEVNEIADEMAVIAQEYSGLDRSFDDNAGMGQ